MSDASITFLILGFYYLIGFLVTVAFAYQDAKKTGYCKPDGMSAIIVLNAWPLILIGYAFGMFWGFVCDSIEKQVNK
jgi:hypothetical protein